MRRKEGRRHREEREGREGNELHVFFRVIPSFPWSNPTPRVRLSSRAGAHAASERPLLQIITEANEGN
jgi:hypothetical protein